MRAHPAFLLLILAPSCTSTVPIEGEDENVLFSDVRMRWPLSGRRDNADPDVPRRSFQTTLEVGGMYGRGTSEQTLRAGEVVELESIPFSGPTTLDTDYGLALGEINVRFGWDFDNGSHLACLAGLGFSSLELEISDGSQVDNDSFFEIGPVFGFAGGHDFGMAGIRASGKLQFGIPDEGSGVAVYVFDAGGVLRFGRQISLGAGWRWVDYKAEQSSGSDIDLRLSGPVVTLTFSS